ncbi:MAG TPA: tetraacyldisaccharide 4'-kinase [Thermoanaerobaculia bacterium]|nr:tetraacyldisaccharide 4'-kinase [Thermoanaerobaculia bacterium]
MSGADRELDLPGRERSPWQRLYGALLARRRQRWAGRAVRLPHPTISVGNLHWGGGGKTPLVAALAATLRDSGRRVGILSRGYGRRERAARVVSVGEGPLVDAEQAGDEPVLLAERLPGVAVAVCGDRCAAAAALEATTAVDCFLLDDAFSHVRVARDLDLLAFPAIRPLGGGRLLPSGRLREPLSASRHADAAVLTGLDRLDAEAVARLDAALRACGFRGRSFGAALEAALLPPAPEATADRFLLVSATARPEAVRRTAERLGLAVVGHLVFRDHHRYRERSLAKVRRHAHAAGAAVLTTSKDRVKLAGRLGLPLWEIAVEARPEPELLRWLLERLRAIEEAHGTSRSRAGR